MPPALPTGSDQESVDEVPAKVEDAPMNDGSEDDENDDEEDDGNTFVVEKILDHRSEFADGQVRFQVKWKGYEKKADLTWETEENLQGAKEMLDEYWAQVKTKTEVKKKRGRQSLSKSTPDSNTKRQRTNQGDRKSKLPQDVDVGALIGFADVGEDSWKPPPVKPGSWDPLVQSVDTVVREGAEGTLWAYLIWNEKNDKGRFYRSKAQIPQVYKACPQRMLHFYERHLVFSTSNSDDAAEQATPS